MDRRVLWAVVLSLLVLYLFDAYFVPPKKQQPPKKAGETGEIPMPEKKVGEVLEEKNLDSFPSTSHGVFMPEKEIKVETPLYSAVFSSRGGTLKRWSLKNYFDQLGKKGKPIEMVAGTKDGRYPFGLTLVWEKETELLNIPFECEQNSLNLTEDRGKGGVVFLGKTSDGTLIKKTFVFSAANYLMEITVEVTPLPTRSLPEGAVITWVQQLDYKKQDYDSSLGFIGPAAFAEGKLNEIKIKKLKEGYQTFSQGVRWAGFEDKYFLAAFLPNNQGLLSAEIVKTDKETVLINCFEKLKPSTQGGRDFFSYGFYCGPKDIDILSSVGRNLEKVIDFGMFDVIAKPLLYILKYFNKFTHNYGWAIILLTIILKVIFFPLTHKSYKSMKSLKDLQPQLTALKKKYGNDREQLNKEMLNLYRTYKVNPLGGCLPLLVQFPIFLAFYWVLLGSIELRHAPFILWINDLSAYDPYYITPVLMGASMFITQKMTPTTGDPTQAKMMLAMPIVFTFMFLKFPSGLVIYWLVNNILQIFQQLYIDKRVS
ncbi:MAG: membrane protein insertase YidC [Thermodesulfobacteriota bacterium]|jgi:YidC/Oxa1 family membrane protein insertase|nr:MAG: membrane protein insertase YidC [Thermodesulfobacteriota bacterium]